MRGGIRCLILCIALPGWLALAGPFADPAQSAASGWFDVLHKADPASVLKLRALGLDFENKNKVLNQVFAAAFERALGERIDPANVSGLFEIVDSIRRGEFRIPAEQASNPYIDLFFPGLAASRDPRATALNAFRRRRELWGGRIYSASPYTSLKWRVEKMIKRNRDPYVPSARIRIIDRLPGESPLMELKVRMRRKEEKLFNSWFRRRPDLVRGLRDNGYLTTEAGAALGRTGADARRLFDHFLVRITNLPHNQAMVARKYQKFHAPRIRRGLRRKSRAAAARFIQGAKTAAQRAVRRIDAAPEALRLEVRACGPALQTDGVCARYAYAVMPGVRHGISIRFTRNQGETLSEKRVENLASRTGREVRELRLPGRYVVSLTVRTLSGKSAKMSEGFDIGGPRETSAQLAKTLQTLSREADARQKGAWEEIMALSEQNRRLGREREALIQILHADKQSLDERKAGPAKDKQAGREHNKRALAINEKVKRLRELQTLRGEMKAEAKALGKSLDRYRTLAQGLTDTLRKKNLDAALHMALRSAVTRDLGYYDRLKNLQDRRSPRGR
ncbi:MAG: hypothetical protein QGH70_08940 [Nitrospinota bacterium]|nr:hypothetical protein [Nitrospinota bacterium]MDP6618902.1 hypothetical protein [Nitrospinota bacterium]